MPGPYVNDETPPGIKFHADPRNAVIGTLRSDASVQDVAVALSEAGIVPGHDALPPGAGGVAFLDRWGTGSPAPSRKTLGDAGVESLHYFDSWTPDP